MYAHQIEVLFEIYQFWLESGLFYVVLISIKNEQEEYLMKSFCELKLIGSFSEQEKLIEQIEQNLCGSWIRDRDIEAEFQSRHRVDYQIFVRQKINSEPTVALFWTPDENGYLYVCNIVPKEVGELGVEDYNVILEEFLTQFVEPSAQNLDVRIVTAEAEKTIDNSMSLELAGKLRRFSNLANKSSCGTHPCDQQRFFDFVIQAHLEKALLDESTLKALLVDEGWSEEYAYELSMKYDSGRELLQQFNP